MKVIDLTIRQIIEICKNHTCGECPLYDSILECWRFDQHHKNSSSYDITELEKEELYE